jgi:hypothetical protein
MHHMRIRRQREKEFDQIDCFGDNDDDLFDVLQGILAVLTKKADNDKEAQQTLEVAEIQMDGRQIYGTIRTGAYGLAVEVRDVRTNTLAFRNREYHADMMPFYFHFDLPKGRDKGILALQRTGILGIHSALSGFLTKEIKKQFPDLILALNLVATKEVIEQYVGKDSELTEIHFLRHELSPDIADAIRKSGAPAQKGSLDFVVKLRDAGFPFQNAILRCVRGTGSPRDLVELFEIPFDVDNVKIKTKTGEKDRTVNLGDPRSGLRADYDVTGDVELAGGHPTLESIHRIASELIEEHRSMLYGKA